MNFQNFYGNADTVRNLRKTLGLGRFPQAVILHGPPGAGKYTLAQMLARCMNCEIQALSDGLPDFCGKCSNCVRIAQADDLEARFAEAVEARENMRDADKKDTRILIQTHPDVMIVPPDPPQMLIKVGQVRRVISTVPYHPESGCRKIFIFTESAFMKEAVNSLLKVLEEPPPYATFFLLTSNPSELPITIRSRCVNFPLAPLPAAEIESFLAREHANWTPQQRALVARLSGGAVGRAFSFDIENYVTARQDALILLQSALNNSSDGRPAGHSGLFRLTEGYRGGADGRSKTDHLLRTLYSLLEDIMFIQSGTPEMTRNTDIQAALAKIAGKTDFSWIVAAAAGLGHVERGMRRNLLRSLSLDAFATSLER